MANMCDFSMKLVGKNENIEKFYKVLTQDGLHNQIRMKYPHQEGFRYQI